MQVNYQQYRTPQFTVLTEDQCRKIHYSSLEVLERTGIQVIDEQARAIYQQAGALVRGDQVYLPASLVEEALRTAPGRITLSGRGERQLFLEENSVYYGLGTDLPQFQDYQSGEYRETLYQDIENVAVVTDYLPGIDYVASLGIASDVNPELADLYHIKAMLEHTTKPLLMTAKDRDNLQGMIDIAAAVRGGYEELRLDPVFLLYTEPITPLKNSPEAHQKLMLAAEYEIPVTYASGISAGATAPVTFAGTLVMGNAECLGGLVLHQLVNPGAPFMYGIVAGVMDMKTTIAVYGGPEVPLYFCAAGELSRFYGLPSFGQAGNTDAGTVDLQAAIDAAFSILVAAHSGTNLVHDVGYIGNGLVGSLEMLVLCDECIGMTERFMQGIDLSEEALAVELIDEVGPGGNYLSTDHTLKNFKKETWYPRYLNRNSYKEWEKGGQKEVKEKIKAEVRKILKDHQAPALDKAVQKEIDGIIASHEEKYS